MPLKIVFDMDNTLADEFGKEARPGMRDLLGRLADDGHALALWTSSTRARALRILADHRFADFFAERVFREDYDRENKGAPKDIRRIGGDVLVDDDPKQIAFVKSVGLRGVLVKSYRGGNESPEVVKVLEKEIRGGFLSRLFE